MRGLWQFTNRYSNLLNDRHMWRASAEDSGHLALGRYASRIDRQPRRTFARMLRAIAVLVAFLAPASGIAAASTVVIIRVGTISPTEVSNDTGTPLPARVVLAKAFTSAMIAHDVDAIVELFTDEDAGPTVSADRSAWQKFEIRLWARRQADMNIRIAAYDYRITEQGAAWDADVYRDDWASVGINALPVTNSVWVHNGKLTNFTSTPRSTLDAEQLGNLWRPGSTPERPTSELRWCTTPC
jgi:hypothetical protein